MRNATVVSGILFLVFWSALLVYTQLSPLAERSGPISYDPLFYPRLLILGGLAISLVVILSGLGTRQQPVELSLRVLASMAIVGAYLLLLKPLGFVLTSVALIVTLATYSGYRKPAALIAVALLVTAVTWFIFTEFLKAPLPAWPRFG